jgi:hypothetical protein
VITTTAFTALVVGLLAMLRSGAIAVSIGKETPEDRRAANSAWFVFWCCMILVVIAFGVLCFFREPNPLSGVRVYTGPNPLYKPPEERKPDEDKRSRWEKLDMGQPSKLEDLGP